MTHPFHPRHGREYVVVAVRQTWGEDRVFFLDEDGTQRSLPSRWTSLAVPDPFVVLLSRADAPVEQGDPLDRLQRLGQLRDAGAITDEEFTAKKAEILQDL